MLQFLQIPIWIKHPVLSKLTNHCTDEELCVDDNHLHKDQLPLAWMVVLQSIHVLGCVPASRQAVGRRLSTLGRCRRASRQPLSEVLVKRNRAGENDVYSKWSTPTSSPVAMQTKPSARRQACRATATASCGDRASHTSRHFSKTESRLSSISTRGVTRFDVKINILR